MMGKLQMDREWTEQDLRTFAEGAQTAFETVLLDELPQDTGWQDEGLQVSYSLCNGRVSCVLHRTVRADGFAAAAGRTARRTKQQLRRS